MRNNNLFGVDVSVYQYNIDWNKAKADGVDFAIIKATQGRAESSSSYLFTDRYFAQNITNAPKAGIKCGVYHYLTAKTILESEIEANHFIQTIEPYRSNIKLYAAVDVESWHLPTDKILLTDIVNRFCECVQKMGYTPIIYTNPDFLKNRLKNISKWNLWLAVWRDIGHVPSSIDYPNLCIWQYGSDVVDGITGSVDSNMGFYKIEEDKEMSKNTPSDWAKKDWEFAIAQGITDGTRPHDPITREEAVVMMLRMHGIAESTLKGEIQK